MSKRLRRHWRRRRTDRESDLVFPSPGLWLPHDVWKGPPHSARWDEYIGNPTCPCPSPPPLPCSVDADCYSGTIATDIAATVSGIANGDCTSGVCTGYNTDYTLVGDGVGLGWITSVSYPCPPGTADSTNAQVVCGVNCRFGPDPPNLVCSIDASIAWNAIWNAGHPDNSAVKRIRQFIVYKLLPPAVVTSGVDYTVPFLLQSAQCIDAPGVGNIIPCTGITFLTKCLGSSSSFEVNFTQV